MCLQCKILQKPLTCDTDSKIQIDLQPTLYFTLAVSLLLEFHTRRNSQHCIICFKNPNSALNFPSKISKSKLTSKIKKSANDFEFLTQLLRSYFLPSSVPLIRKRFFSPPPNPILFCLSFPLDRKKTPVSLTIVH